ncbi:MULTISPECIES: hypothetical protein [unclassified Micromonospora]|uniref:hypothetical protein n=1 Tax=unclassified Micromonospora TaxID=2617518 RepID=UPI00098D6116|nr:MULTISPECIES: hypothetical protein [unclassified Micromonospora]OON27787.1 hypothetical protein BSA16_30275 [Micromonospora sp. Rc5]
MSVEVAGSCRVLLHELRLRPDGDDWIVGRVDTGDFVAVPEIAAAALRLLGAGHSVDETHRRLRAERGREIDVAGFVRDLVGLGFVAAVDGRPVPGAPVPAPTLPRLRPRHVRWLVARPVAVAVLAVTGAAAVTALLAPGVLPSHRDLLWSPHASLVLAGNAAVAWSIVLLHELAHLLTARAHGVPGRLGLGTRLQFLVAQTDVSGIWAAPRSARLTVYLAGMVVNVVVASVAVLVRAAAAPGTPVDRAAAVVLLLAVLPLPVQFLVFMRTDVYFVLQDVAGARNLYADGAAYARWWLRRATRRPGADPSLALPARERRAVRWYALLLVVGTAACLAVAATVTVPFTLALLVDAAGGLRPGGDPVDRFDAAVTAAVLGGSWAVWGWAWWRRHGRRLHARRRARRAGPQAVAGMAGHESTGGR